jgi:hypothetical protein
MYVRRHGRLHGATEGDPAHTDLGHWWVGIELACPECACHFCLQEQDESGARMRSGEWGTGMWHCPECDARIEVDELQATQPPPEEDLA